MKSLTRRTWARLAALGAFSPGTLAAGSRILSAEPRISAQDFAQFPEVFTPVEDFYVRNHFPQPDIDMAQWRIRIDGAVERPATMSLGELRARRQQSLISVLECAGNGVGSGGVGCARWHGPLLGELIRQCGMVSEARYVRLTGADRGREPDSGPVEISFSRTIPLDIALMPEAVVAIEMNGVQLSPDHGFPARVVIAGQYGMNSVKWLERIELLAAPPGDLFMARRFRRVVNDQVVSQVADMPVKSIIAQPKSLELIRGSVIEAGGYAWGGGDIARVEVSLDDGLWQRANFLPGGSRYGWAVWKAAFADTQPGVHTLVVRACTESGACQPQARDPARQDEYELNQYHRIRLFVRP